MKTKLHELTKWMVAMLLCTISFTAFAEDADFTGTTVEFQSNDLAIGNGTYTFVEMKNGKPAYQGDILAYGETMTCDLYWKLSPMSADADAWVIEYSSGWGANESAYNIQPTDSVPMNGWMINGNSPITATLSGCVVDNIVIDPLEGTSITVAGVAELNGEYIYNGVQNTHNTFVDTLEIGVVTIMYNGGWQVVLGADSVLYTNDLYNNLVPENNWVAQTELSDVITISSDDELTVNYFDGYTLYVEGDKYAGTYNFSTTVNGYPAYALVGDQYQTVVYKNDTAWVMATGLSSVSDFTGFAVEAYSLKSAELYVPQNGWTNFANEIFAPEFSGWQSTKFITEGETVTIVGTDFDAELVYTGDDNYSHSFAGTVDGVEVSIASVNDVWAITYNDSVYFTCDAYISSNYVPNYSWVDANGVYSALTVSGLMTGSPYDGEVAQVSGLEESVLYFEFAGIVNDRISFIYDTKVLKCVENVWGIYADADATSPLAVSSITTPFLVPQNGWADGITISNNNVSEFVFEADILTVYNTGSDVDGAYAFDSIDNDGYPVYSNTVGDDTYHVAYVSYKWQILVGDSSLYTCDNRIYLGNNSVIPQNSWVSLTDSTSFVYTSGDYTADVYTDYEISFNNMVLTYNGMVNNRYSYASDDNYLVQYNGTTWEILLDGEIVYTNNLVSETLPSNQWIGEGEAILINGSETTYYYGDIEITGLSIAEANGTYSIVDNDAYYPAFSKEITTGEYAGSTVTVNVSYSNATITLSTADNDSVLCENDVVNNNSIYKKLVSQNCWSVDGVYSATIAITGEPTSYVDAVILTGSDYDTKYSYIYGSYYASIEGTEYYFEIINSGDSTFWAFKVSGGAGASATGIDVLSDDDYIAVNTNMNGGLLPQNNWVVGGVVDSSFTIFGDSTFFVEDEPASLVDSKVVEFAIYPNPAQFEVNIDVAAAGSLEVYSLSGAIVMSSFLEEGHNTVSISSLDKGIYLLITNTDGNREVSRLIKE